MARTDSGQYTSLQWVSSLIRAQQNGGSVVPLEKNADMLIADHIRKDAPPGSYSWKWIEDSVNKGILQSKNDAAYLIGRVPEESRPVASAVPGRSTRTPFTATDDSDLIKWVLASSKNDKGNVVYQDLARVNSRHTYQSWRDRWVKKLCFLSQEALQKRVINSPPARQPAEKDLPAPHQPEEASVPQPELQSQEAVKQLQELASQWPRGQWWHKDHPPEQPVHQRTIYSMARVTKYVLEADDRLEDLWREGGILLRLANTTGSGLLTREVADAAREQIKTYYRSQMERPDDMPAEPLTVTTSSADRAQPADIPLPHSQAGSTRPAEPRPSQGTKPQSPRRFRYTPEHDLLLANSVKRAIQHGIQAGPKWFQEFAEENPEHTWQSWRDHWLKVLRPRIEAAESNGQEYDFHHAYFTAPTEFQGPASSRISCHPAVKGRIFRQRTTSPETAAEVMEEELQQIEDLPVEHDDERTEFLAIMAAYLEVMELSIDLQPKICRQEVDLYLLHVAVEACRDLQGKEDWQQVAEQLGFSHGQYPNAPKLLRKCYDNSLRDFISTLEETDDDPEPATEELDKSDAADQYGELGRETKDPELMLDDSREQLGRQDTVQHGTGATPVSSAASRGFSFGAKRNSVADGAHGLSAHGSSAHKRQRRSRDDEVPSTPENIPEASDPAGSGISTPIASKSIMAGIAMKEEVYDSQDTADFEITPSQQLHQEEMLTTPIPLQLPIRDPVSVRRVSARRRESQPGTDPGGWDFTLGAANQKEHSIRKWSVNVAEAHEQSGEEHLDSDTDEDAEEVARKVEYYESFGYSRKVVCQALTATCMETGIASEVMEMLREHPNQGLPNNMTGVWTSKDDEGLKFICGEPSSDPKIESNRAQNVARERRRLEHKHGRSRITTRIDFLAITRYEANRKRMETFPIP
ncbi:hypothetical protein ACHAQH_000791 [Verticillium albo-atrum]